MNKKAGYASQWIHELENRKRWELYWMQQKLMQPFLEADDQIVEIGVGSGFCSNYLRYRNFSVTTVDIDPDKKPDIVADVSKWKPDFEINAVMAFQVFEHIPFDVFKEIIANLAHNNVLKLFVSVPRNVMSKRLLLDVDFYFPVLQRRRFSVYWPPRSVPPKSKYHLWELDDPSISTQKYLEVYEKLGFRRVETRHMHYARYDVFVCGSNPHQESVC